MRPTPSLVLTARLGVLFATPGRVGDGLTAVHARLTGPGPLGGALPVTPVATVAADVPVAAEVPLTPAVPVVP